MGIHLSPDEGALLVNELDYDVRSGSRTGARVAVGYWRYTGEYSDLLHPGETRDDNAGFYLLAETPVVDIRSNRFQGFLRAGEQNRLTTV